MSHRPSPAFGSTRWSLVLRVRGEVAERRRALEELCAIYWPPVLAFYRTTTRNDEDASDLTQGLFADLLERDDLTRVERERGRFRSFLLAAARNFQLKDLERRRAKKRGGDHGMVSMADTALPEDFGHPVENETPEAAFERSWARSVIESARRALAEDYAARDQRELFAQLEPCLQGEEHAPYTELAERLAMRVGAIKVAVHRMRQRFRERLVAEVRQTLGEGEDPLAELRALLAAVTTGPTKIGKTTGSG